MINKSHSNNTSREKFYMQGEQLSPWRENMHELIFESDTISGKVFDIALIICIVLSVLGVMLSSIDSFNQQYGQWLDYFEWVFTILFSIEYILRIICVRKPLLYMKSFFGIVDLLSILPSYIALFFGGAQTMMVIRALRVLRIFRIFKLGEYLGEAHALIRAMSASTTKILVFLYTVLIAVIIFGSAMYLVEGGENGFSSIPKSIYWAIVTITTVGYGDVAPQTALGQALASAVMIMGYAIIAVPTGIYTTELARQYKRDITNTACQSCGKEGHASDANYCKFCGNCLDING